MVGGTGRIENMQRTHRALALCFGAGMLWSATAPAGPGVYPTGATRYDPDKAYNVFVLFSGADDKTHLIDMDGNEVHRWDHRGFPSGMLDPALVGGACGHGSWKKIDSFSLTFWRS